MKLRETTFFFVKVKDSLRQAKGKTWSRGTNLLLPFTVRVTSKPLYSVSIAFET